MYSLVYFAGESLEAVYCVHVTRDANHSIALFREQCPIRDGLFCFVNNID